MGRRGSARVTVVSESIPTMPQGSVEKVREIVVKKVQNFAKKL